MTPTFSIAVEATPQAQARRAWEALAQAETFESAASAHPVRPGPAGWAAGWAAQAVIELRLLTQAREAQASLDRFVALTHNHVPQGLIDDLRARVDEHDAALPEGDWRRYGTPDRLCRMNHAAAVAAACAANGLGALRVSAAKAALMANYNGPGAGVNPLMERWRSLHRKQEAMRHRGPDCDGSIREHAARWLADPIEENRVRLALFVA
jgi:hypothetical protein